MPYDREFIPDETVFLMSGQKMLSDVLRALEDQLNGTPLRDARSAFRFLTERAGVDLTTTVATTKTLRSVFEALHPASLGVSEKRFANIRSILIRAVEEYGQPRIWLTRDFDMAPEWETLLARIPRENDRWGLHRLAYYCTKKGISPQEVKSETLEGFQVALDAEGAYKDPKAVLKTTINRWNRCVRTVTGWPRCKLSRPNPRSPYMFPLDRFPKSFQDDVAAWEKRMRHPDILDPNAPLRAFRPDTIEGYARHVLDSVAPKTADSAIRGLKVVIKAMAPDRDWRWLMDLGNRLKSWARPKSEKPLPRLTPAEMFRIVIHEMDTIAKTGITSAKVNQRYRDMLIVATLISAPIRMRNLAMIETGRHLVRTQEGYHLRFLASETKTHQALHLVLPDMLTTYLERYISEVRPYFPGADAHKGLWCGQKGNPLSHATLYSAVCSRTKALFGEAINPHRFRSIAASFLAQSSPSDALLARPLLGHRRIETTQAYYVKARQIRSSQVVSDAVNKIKEAPSPLSKRGTQQ